MAKGRRSARWVGPLGALVLGAAMLAPVLASGSGVGAGAAEPKVALPHSVPTIPVDAKTVGAPPSDQVLHLDVVLAGQNPSGLAAEVAAVSTPGSPQYHHYLTAAQYAALFGPTPSTVAQVSSALRAEGLTVGTSDPGSGLLPVSGTAAVVSSALGTTLQTVQVPNQSRAIVNTTPPQIPASLVGLVTNVVGLDGLFHEHSMLKTRSDAPSQPAGGAAVPGLGSSGSSASGAGAQGHAVTGHFANPQACLAAASAATLNPGSYTSTQLAQVYGLDQVFGQGRIGVGQTIAVVEFERYAQSDYNAFLSCYGLNNPIHNVLIDGGPPGPNAGQGEAALDVELAAVNAPGASLAVYEAPNGNNINAFDLFNRIASDDSAQIVTTSWGNCEISGVDLSDMQTENAIFSRMALQGQTIIAASGDAGSEDCFNTNTFPPNFDTTLAVDDPGSQPAVLSAGGTTLPTSTESSQSVWNNGPGGSGAGGGGFSTVWTQAYQPGANGQGYRFVASDGGIFDFGSAGFFGSAGGMPINAPVVGMADTPSANGYWLVASDGGIFTYGDARFFGSMGGQHLNKPIVGIASTPYGDGYWEVASDGGIFTFGSAQFFGSAGSIHLNKPVVGMQATPDGRGYWLVASDGGIFTYGDAHFYGSTGSIALNKPIVGMAAGPGGNGYWLVATDGGIFAYGSAVFHGSMGGTRLNQPVVGMAATPDEGGYWEAAADGGIFTFGDAQFFGSTGSIHLNKPIVGMSSAHSNRQRAVPDLSYAADPNNGGVMAYWNGQWTAFGGTSVGAPTNAGLFADTNQGCYNPLGMVAPNLYASGTSPGNFFDVTSGNNDYTGSHGGTYGAGAGFDQASGLGTPIDNNLAIALQGADGCPSVNAVTPNSGPLSGSGPITISGGGFANATQVVFGAVGSGTISNQNENSITVVPPTAAGPQCVDVVVVNSQGISATSSADRYGFGGVSC